jgi:SAM-dependent methyltransferase
VSDEIDYSIYYRRWNSGSLDELKQGSKVYDRWIGELIKAHSPDLKVLDYGAGFGSLVYYLKAYFHDVCGVDASEEQVAVAQQNGLPVELVTVDNFTAWCGDHSETFDIIFLFDVLEHVPVSEQVRFMRTLHGILKRNGFIYIKVPNANSLLASRWRYNDWTHHSSFTECSLDFVCLNAGFEDMRYMSDDSSMTPRYWWVPRWGLRRYYLKRIGRALWKAYLKAELGAQADSIFIGYNLFARARKL